MTVPAMQDKGTGIVLTVENVAESARGMFARPPDAFGLGNHVLRHYTDLAVRQKGEAAPMLGSGPWRSRLGIVSSQAPAAE